MKLFSDNIEDLRTLYIANLKKALDMEQHITKAALARKLHTSRSQIDRVLDPNNEDVTVSTLRKVAGAIGHKLKLELVAA